MPWGPLALRERIGLGWTFTGAALRYWLIVFPAVLRELHRLRSRAQEIPDLGIRTVALEALGKQGNIEGAAAFAVFAPRRARAEVVRALVAFQAAYNLTDTLAEQPSLDRSESARQLHERLHSAFAPEAACLDPLERQPQIDDDGYLAEILEGCREAVGRLPSYPLVASALQGATERIVTFQSLSSAPAQSAHQAFEGWALEADAPADAMWWWEMAAAAGSSLPVHALIAAAADGRLQAAEVRALERAYFPWVGALHSLLDSVVDQAEDAELQQLSLIGCYPSTEQAAVGMARIATEAARRTRALPGGRRHAVMLAGMTGFYLHAARSSSPAHDRELPGITEGVLTGVGPLVRPVLRVFAARALAGRLVRAGSPSRRRTRSAPAASSDWCSGEGGVDAGAA